ncbi:unnamed protein product [Effrenium voratum]|nr:unnamed protein product [Effrenium voratum]
MEPVSILLATGAIAIYAAHRAEKMTEKARRGPLTLPEVLDAQQVDDAAPVQLLAVHVRSGRFHRKLFQQSVKVRVKYGAPGSSIHCDTPQVRLLPQEASPAARFVSRLHRDECELLGADFGTTCLFLGQRTAQNRIRLRLMRPGLLGRTMAKAELLIPDLGQCCHWMEFQPELTCADQQLGNLEIALETRVMLKGELRRFLKLLGAKKQQEGFLMDILPVAEGQVAEDNGQETDEEGPPVVRGEIISSQKKRASLVPCCGRLTVSPS